MIFLFCSYLVITHLINLQVSFTFFIVQLILGLSASSLFTLQSRLMCCLCKPFPPQKPHIFLVVLLCITYDHTHLKEDMHPAKTNAMHPEIITLVRIFEGRIQIHRAFICGHHNFRWRRERLSPFDFWFDWDYSRSLTSKSGSRDTNIQESDDWQRSSVRFSIVCRKGCSEFFIKQSVFEESSKCPIPTNKHPGWMQSIPLSVAGELLNAS